MNQTSIKANIERITPLTDSILQLMLTPHVYKDYIAGQYLQIISHEDAISYSIANAPLGSQKYELHIRHSPDNPYNQTLLSDIKNSGSVNIQLPLGECHLNKLSLQKPILFIAAGTGFAPIKAMIEQLLANGEPPSFELYWGARAQSDLYMDDKVKQWQGHVQQFQYFSLLSTMKKESFASKVLNHHKKDLSQWQIVISGPFDMVYKTRDSLVAAGALKQNLFSDAFSFENNTH